MSLFIKKIFLLLSSIFILILIYQHFLGLTNANMPALKISNSFDYNEKMALLRNNNNANNIAIGSSASLFNLHSQTIISNLKSNSYFNISSLGLSIEDIYSLLVLYSQIHNPNSLIMGSVVADFTAERKVVNYQDLKAYLTNTGLNETYLKYFDLSYTLQEMKEKSKEEDESHEDLYGGKLIRCDSVKEKLMRDETNRKYCHTLEVELDFSDSVRRNNYEKNFKYLDSIISFCNNKSIELYFFQSPIRKGVLDELDKQVSDKLKIHVDRVQKIISNRGHFVRTDDILWEDKFFRDAVHMNSVGAQLFTQYCFNKCR